MEIHFDYYRIFYYVAKYQNVTLAANALLSNQPNVTRTVKKLEQELGCSLFVRSNRGVRLTPEGEKLYSHVRIAVEQIALAEQELSGARTLQEGIVSVGATEIALHTFLLPVLNEYRGQFPGIHLSISNYTTTQAIAALKNSLVDIAVVMAPHGDEIKGLSSRELKTVQEVPVCGPYFSDLSGHSLTLSELSGYPLISLTANTRTYAMYSRWFSQNGILFSPAIEAATANQILPLVRNNLGIGFVPEDFLEGDGGRVYRLVLTQDAPKRSVLLLKRRDGTLSAAAKALERLILERRKQLRQAGNPS